MDRPKFYKSSSKGDIEISSMHGSHAAQAANALERNSGDPAVIDALRIHAWEKAHEYVTANPDVLATSTPKQHAAHLELEAHYKRIMGQ